MAAWLARAPAHGQRRVYSRGGRPRTACPALTIRRARPGGGAARRASVEYAINLGHEGRTVDVGTLPGTGRTSVGHRVDDRAGAGDRRDRCLLTAGDDVVVDGRMLDGTALRALYEPRGYEPLWSQGRRRSDRRVCLPRSSRQRRTAWTRQRTTRAPSSGGAPDPGPVIGPRSTCWPAMPSVLLGTHLRQGAVRPERVEKDAFLALRPVDLQAIASQAAAAPDLPAYLDGLAPATPTYRGLMEALARYREIAASGGWPAVPPKGPVLKPGAVDPAIPKVRARLAATGDYAGRRADGRGHEALRRRSRRGREALPEPIRSRCGRRDRRPDPRRARPTGGRPDHAARGQSGAAAVVVRTTSAGATWR